VTLTALRGVVHAMRGWPTPLGIAVNSVEQRPFDAAGALADPAIAGQIDMLAAQLMAPVGAIANA
jgi:FMN reductase